jgi:hypothetical protein
MPLAASIALAVSLALSGSQAPSAQVGVTIPAAQNVEEYVRNYFADTPIMIEVARCESQFRQFDKEGKVLKNPTSTAKGIMQIMESIHAEDAKETYGFDILTIDGNLGYAKLLYEKQGIKPWMASSACWKKTTAYKELALNK